MTHVDKLNVAYAAMCEAQATIVRAIYEELVADGMQQGDALRVAIFRVLQLN